jgi:4-hydroxy-3-methylbut-2-en-1-yl diphosphate reductase
MTLWQGCMPTSDDKAGPGNERCPSCGETPLRRPGLRRLHAGDVEIIVERHAGYCYGVKRALRMTEEALAGDPEHVASLGPLIHNPSVVGDLEQRGVEVVDDVAWARDGTLIVRTHGVVPAALTAARARDLDVVDATCPFVAVAQRKAAALREAGYTVVVLGERDHPEVAGLMGFAGEGAVVVEDVAGLPLGDLGGRRVGLVVQTTQTRARLADVAGALAAVARELLVHNTICDATERRQSAACELAREVDVVVVVGGRDSANTVRLAQLCRAIGSRTYHVESAAELRADWFAGASRIGVTAGASTPDSEIEAVVCALRQMHGG